MKVVVNLACLWLVIPRSHFTQIHAINYSLMVSEASSLTIREYESARNAAAIDPDRQGHKDYEDAYIPGHYLPDG